MATVSADRLELIQKLIEKRQAARGGPALPQPRVRADRAPLSWNQQQIWLHSQIAPGVPLYNEPFTIYRRGPVDTACLERSLNEVIRRHEILRTAFPTEADGPVQAIAPKLEIRIAVCEAPDEDAAIALATQDAIEPFDLANLPLIRARLVRLSECDRLLFLTLHHIVFDGVSIYHVLLPELAAIYEAFAKGEPHTLAPPTFQYADYAVWQRRHMSPQVEYWSARLGEHPARLTLPADRSRPRWPSFRGALYPFVVDKAATAALQQLARETGASLYMVLLAAFKLLLHEYTGQADIVIGTVTAGRSRPEFASTFGYFLNPLALRTSLGGQPSFREIVERVRRVVLEALDHSETPFELVARTLDAHREPGRNPFFDVLFSLEPPAGAPPPGWDLRQTRVDVGLSKFDLSLEFDERPDGLDGRFVYSTDLFDRAAIKMMCRDWTALLASVAQEPDRRIGPPRVCWKSAPELRSHRVDRPFLAPRTVTERAIAGIWSELLGWNAPIGIFDDFFALGGHSLLAAQLQRSLERAFGRRVEIREIYAHPTIEGLAGLL